VCGIAGYVGSGPLPRQRVARCLEEMRRRGPDAAGDAAFRTPSGRHVHLLNTRLSIVDLDPRSNQPFRDGPLTLTYNGELYNHLELRAELERAGCAFRTRSDTEVVVAALELLGPDAFDRFEGMWALAAYDERDGSLLLSRDPFGEKPLYLLREGDALYFGSEPKFVFALRGAALEPDLDHVRRYLVNGYKALHKRGETFFRGLEELPAGTLLRAGPMGGEDPVRYWWPTADVDATAGRDELVARVRERIVRSVELRLRADVPLAFCMSGGVDSTALISIAKRICGYDVHGFTIENEDSRYDEREAVAASVAALGIRHERVALTTGGFLEGLGELVGYHDAPVYTISYYVHWRLMERIAAAGYRVSVSGTGADELFSGYYDHHLAYLQGLRDPDAQAAALAAWERRVKPFVRNPFLSDPDLFVRDPAFRGHIYLDAERFSAALVEPWSEPFEEQRYDPGLLRNRMLNELLHEAVPPILHEDDLNAMYFSIENRSPYLDRALFDAAYSAPPAELVRDGYAKSLLRDAMRGIAPDHVLDEPRKIGFNAPIAALVDGRDPETRAAILADGPIFDVVRKERVEQLLDAGTLPNSESKFLFYVLSAKAFLERFGA
jgi:asparagine synthase (glutamine-hydrolysing)